MATGATPAFGRPTRSSTIPGRASLVRRSQGSVLGLRPRAGRHLATPRPGTRQRARDPAGARHTGDSGRLDRTPRTRSKLVRDRHRRRPRGATCAPRLPPFARQSSPTVRVRLFGAPLVAVLEYFGIPVISQRVAPSLGDVAFLHVPSCSTHSDGSARSRMPHPKAPTSSSATSRRRCRCSVTLSPPPPPPPPPDLGACHQDAIVSRRGVAEPACADRATARDLRQVGAAEPPCAACFDALKLETPARSALQGLSTPPPMASAAGRGRLPARRGTRRRVHLRRRPPRLNGVEGAADMSRRGDQSASIRPRRGRACRRTAPRPRRHPTRRPRDRPPGRQSARS